MPSKKRHSKKVVTSDKPSLPPSAVSSQHPNTDDVKTSKKVSKPQESRQPERRTELLPQQQTWSLQDAFQKQYYSLWIATGVALLLLAVGYQREVEPFEFLCTLWKNLLRFMERGTEWSQGWRVNGDVGIDRRSNLSLEEFHRVYDGKRPVLITDVLQSWGAIHWTKAFFMSTYGKHRVVMKAVDGSLHQAEGFSLPLELFVSHIDDCNPTRWTYLEDEIFLQNIPDLRSDIGSCVHLEEDFFKLFPEEVRPWDAMFLWGSRFSRSSLHIDPYNWTGTNAVFKGMKKWKLYPPGQDEFLYVNPNAMSGFPLNTFKYNSPVDAFAPDLRSYPDFAKAKAIEFTQYPGELLIIPTGWFHQAYNAQETMAVSGQVMNTANYRIVLEEIMKADNLNLDLLPDNIDDLSPAEQVRAAVKAIPQRILDEGQKVNENVRSQIKRQPHEHS